MKKQYVKTSYGYREQPGYFGLLVCLSLIGGGIILLQHAWPYFLVLFVVFACYRWGYPVLRGIEYHGELKKGDTVTWQCSHRHRTRSASNQCSQKERMRREALIQKQAKEYRNSQDPLA